MIFQNKYGIAVTVGIYALLFDSQDGPKRELRCIHYTAATQWFQLKTTQQAEGQNVFVFELLDADINQSQILLIKKKVKDPSKCSSCADFSLKKLL